MKIDSEIKNDVVVIHLSGKVMGGPDATQFHGQLHEYADAGKKKVVVDLAKVEWVNSVGLGMFMAAHAALKRIDGLFKLANVAENIQNLLTITQLIKIFDTYDSIEDAINSF